MPQNDDSDRVARQGRRAAHRRRRGRRGARARRRRPAAGQRRAEVRRPARDSRRSTSRGRRSASRSAPTSSPTRAAGQAGARPSSDTALPHWTDPPTGELPRIFAAEDLEDDAAPWSSFTSRPAPLAGRGARSATTTSTTSPGWPTTRPASGPSPTTTAPTRRTGSPWTRTTIAGTSRNGAGRRRRRWSDDDWPEEVAGGGHTAVDLVDARAGRRRAPPTTGRRTPAATCPSPSASASASRPSPSSPSPPARGSPSRSSSPCSRWPPPSCSTCCARPATSPRRCSAWRRARRSPLAAYWQGEAGLPVVLFLTVVFGLLWYLVGAGGNDRPVIGLSSTLLGVCYVGLLGSFAALMLALGQHARHRRPRHRHPARRRDRAPWATTSVGFVIGRNAGQPAAVGGEPEQDPRGAGRRDARRRPREHRRHLRACSGSTRGPTSPTRLLLGLAVAVAAPLGDLCESLIKRDLDVKDMGTILPGHGGFLDRFDALLFVLPAVYYLARSSCY